MTDRQYPIGRFEFQESYTLEELSLMLDRSAAHIFEVVGKSTNLG